MRPSDECQFHSHNIKNECITPRGPFLICKERERTHGERGSASVYEDPRGFAPVGPGASVSGGFAPDQEVRERNLLEIEAIW